MPPSVACSCGDPARPNVVTVPSVKLDAEVADWIDAAAEWWLRELGPIGSELALPTADQFPLATPDALLEAVQRIAGLSDWSFEPIDESGVDLDDPLANVPRPARPVAQLTPESPDDTPLPHGGPYPIPYSREDAGDPTILIATFARGVSHYHIASATEEPPCAEDQREAFIELGAVLLGFGVLLANSTFQFSQYDNGGMHGWTSSARGALGEDALGYALALFVELAATDPKLALAHLRANPKASFKWATSQLHGARQSTLDRLRAVQPIARAQGPYR